MFSLLIIFVIFSACSVHAGFHHHFHKHDATNSDLTHEHHHHGIGYHPHRHFGPPPPVYGPPPFGSLPFRPPPFRTPPFSHPHDHGYHCKHGQDILPTPVGPGRDSILVPSVSPFPIGPNIPYPPNNFGHNTLDNSYNNPSNIPSNLPADALPTTPSIYNVNSPLPVDVSPAFDLNNAESSTPSGGESINQPPNGIPASSPEQGSYY